MPQISFLYPTLSVKENLQFNASVYGLGWLSRRERLRELLDVVELWPDRGKLVSQLSGGMRKRLSLACALVHNPRLIFLDEPTSGIDPILRQRFWDYFRRLRDGGKALLITSHYVAEAEYCDQVTVIAGGHLVALGTPLELRRKAVGGDAVDITTRGLNQEILGILRQVSGVASVRPLSHTTVRVLVPEAGEAIPLLVEVLQNRGIQIDSILEYRPTFDEVFANLVGKVA